MALAMLLLPGAARSEPASQPPAKAGPCDGAFLSAAALSDYRFDGVSESNRRSTWQVTGYCYWNNGVFVGGMLTGIDFEDTPRTPVEADWYVGRQVGWRGAKITYDLFYASFPGRRSPGASYDIIEPQIEVSRTVQKVTFDGQAGWEAYVSGAGQEWRIRAGATYALTPWLSVGGHYGRFIGATGADHDHDFYDAGATATWRRLSFDIRYGGTDLPLFDCYYTRWCRPGGYAGVTWRLYP